MAEIIITAEELQAGDVILTPGYDADGAYTEWRFEVASQPVIFRTKVRFKYDDSRSQTLVRGTKVRVERES